MDFLEALSQAAQIISESNEGKNQQELDEIYLYEPRSQTQIFLKTMLKDGRSYLIPTNSIDKDLPLLEQIFLGGFLDADGLRKDLSLDDIFNDWEVCIKKTTRQTISKKGGKQCIKKNYAKLKQADQ